MSDLVDSAPQRFIGSGESFASVGLDVSGIAFGHPLRLRWWLAFVAAVGLGSSTGPCPIPTRCS